MAPVRTEEEFRATAAEAITNTIEALLEQSVPMHVIVDQLLTWATFASVRTIGEGSTAVQLEQIAARVRGGIFRKHGAGGPVN